MDQVCADRTRYSLDEAERFVTEASELQSRRGVSYVVAAACGGCRSWHLHFVERALQFAN